MTYSDSKNFVTKMNFSSHRKGSHKNLYMNFRNTFTIIAKNWNQPRYPSVDEWLKYSTSIQWNTTKRSVCQDQGYFISISILGVRLLPSFAKHYHWRDLAKVCKGPL